MSHLVDHGDQLDRQHTAQQPRPGTTPALIYLSRTARSQVPRGHPSGDSHRRGGETIGFSPIRQPS
jgi:hypothetical protein